ncbi:MAG TPA: hypothetical protein VIO64_22900 [Pseudobacteroides sp.]|uniref:hypothetical protein n=1 Tax=Pseudobacteroides sp. TaxID=1968840 RepID=UPI002F922E40
MKLPGSCEFIHEFQEVGCPADRSKMLRFLNGRKEVSGNFLQRRELGFRIENFPSVHSGVFCFLYIERKEDRFFCFGKLSGYGEVDGIVNVNDNAISGVLLDDVEYFGSRFLNSGIITY